MSNIRTRELSAFDFFNLLGAAHKSKGTKKDRPLPLSPIHFLGIFLSLPRTKSTIPMKGVKITLLYLATILTISCSHDKEDVDISDRSEALLGQWEYESIMTDHAVDVNGDGTSNIDLFNTQEIKQCKKDDLTFFNQDGPSGKDEYLMTENALACENNDSFSILEEDFYKLLDDNSTISFEKRDEMRIIELTKKKLVVETDDVINDQNIIITITYKKG